LYPFEPYIEDEAAFPSGLNVVAVAIVVVVRSH
jgi:hypothetical protein